MKNLMCRAGTMLVLGVASLVFGQGQPADLAKIAATPMVEHTVKRHLDVDAFWLVDLALPAQPGAAFEVVVPLGGAVHVMVMEPSTVRGEGFRAYVQGDRGMVAIVPPTPATYAGWVEGQDESVVAGSLIGGQLHAIIKMGNGPEDVWSVHPLSKIVPDAPRTIHVVTREADIKWGDWRCGVADVGRVPQPMPGGGGTEAVRVCELALEADFQFYQSNGSNENTTIADMENVINAMNVIYVNETELTHQVVFVIVRTTSGSNPYTTNNPGNLLDQFRAHWSANFGTVKRDLAHLFTGRNLDGSVIGIAYLPGVCTSGQAYGLSQSKFSNNFTSRVGLTAHEVGHNWNASHCDSLSPCFIMCSGLGGCGGSLTQFGVHSANAIKNYSNQVGCLSPLEPNPVALPFFDNFESNNVDTQKWTINSGGAVSTAGTNPPSPTRSLNLDGADTITSVRMDVPTTGGLFEIRYWTQRKNVETFKALHVEYFSTSAAAWKDLNIILSDGETQTNFESWVHALPSDARGSEFRLRFTAVGFQPDDDWYIDDVQVLEIPPPPVALPFFDDFTGSEINPVLWSSFSGVELSTAGTNPPSPTQSLNLDLSDTITSNRIDVPAPGGDPLVISYYLQRKINQSFRALHVEYFSTSANAWKELTIHLSDGVVQNTFDYHEFPMPADGHGVEFRLRFTSIGFLATDDWYVDDVRVGASASEPPLALPFFDPFAAEAIDPVKWTSVNGATTSTAGTNPPSAPRTLNLDNADDLTSAKIDAPASASLLWISYSTQHKGVENGKTLDVEYFSTSLGVFKSLQTIASNGVDQVTFRFHEFPMPADGYGGEFRLRFRANGTAANDDWYVDDVRVGGFCRADIEQDGDLDVFDFLAFQSEWSGQTYLGDFENDGDWDVFDFLAFQSAYAGGCY